jgi:7-cyano-7-deazaguanine reductase
VYVSLGDGKEVHVVPVSLADQLEKPASDYRKTQLVDLPSNQVKQLTITDKDGKVALKAEKRGEDWQLIEPAKMPAEKRDVDDIIFAATGLRAVEFVSENATADGAKYQLNKPQLTVSLSTEAPTTQAVPATTPTSQAAPKVITFGRHDDILKKNVYASVSGSPSIAKVAATVLESFNKKPLQLRDKRAVNVDPEQVSKLSFAADVAATTQPTSKPASKREVAVQRRKEALTLGPAVPTTKPTSGPATTQAATTQAAATQPAPEQSKWELLSDPKGEASDAKVGAVLNALHPLRIEKYLETIPTTQAKPVATYTINLTTEAAGGANVTDHLIRLTDRGNDQPLVGEYNGLAFELDRAILRHLEGEFTKGAAAASASPSIPQAEMNRPLSHLGSKSTLTDAEIAQPRTILEAFPNPKPQRDYEVKFVFPEFTSMCPGHGQPDFATITVQYVPDQRCVEMKSLKLYFLAYRNKGIFYEAVVNTILDDLVAMVDPRRMTIIGDFAVRGGTAGTGHRDAREARGQPSAAR